MKQLILIAAVILITTGCTTRGMVNEGYDNAAKTFKPDTGRANIYVVREYGFKGGPVSFSVYLNGKNHGYINNGSFLMLEVDKGRHKIEVNTLESKSEVIVDAVEGKNYYLEVSVQVGWNAARAELERISEREGKRIVNEGYRSTDFRKMCSVTTALKKGTKSKEVENQLGHFPVPCHRGDENLLTFVHPEKGIFLMLLFNNSCNLLAVRSVWCEKYFYEKSIETEDSIFSKYNIQKTQTHDFVQKGGVIQQLWKMR